MASVTIVPRFLGGSMLERGRGEYPDSLDSVLASTDEGQR